MEGTDKMREAPEPDKTSEKPTDNDYQQTSTRPDTTEVPHSLSTASPSRTLDLGPSLHCLLGNIPPGKRKATESPVSHGRRTSTKDDSPRQLSIEQPGMNSHHISTPGSKKFKIENELVGQNVMESQETGLFVSQDKEPIVHPDELPFSPHSIGLNDKLNDNLEHKLALIAAESNEQVSDSPVHTKALNRNMVKGYDTEVERKESKLKIDHPSVDKTKRMVFETEEHVSRRLEDHPDLLINDKEIQISYKLLQEISSPENLLPPDRSVLVLGTPGVGKSALVSAILNFIQAAFSQGGTRSCTNVKFEYVHAGYQVEAYFVAVVYTLDDVKITSKVRDNVSKILAWKHYDKNVHRDGFLQEQFDELKEERIAALDFLAPLLVAPYPQSEFNSRDSLEQHIMACSHDKERHIAKCLSRSILAFLVGYRSQTGERFEASSLAVLQAKTGLRQRAGREAGSDPRISSLWRLVDKISIHIPSLVLENRLCLYDVPGINLDTEKTREETGNAALETCRTVVVVFRSDRCCSNTNVRNIFHKLIRNDQDFIAVPTRLDDFGLEDWLDVEISDEDLSLLRDQATQESEKLDDYDPTRVAEIDTLITERRHAVRTESITKDVQELVRDLQREERGHEGEPLKVFPVAGTIYESYMKGFDTRRPNARPKVGIAHAGIVDLRTFLRDIPGEMAFRALFKTATDLKKLIIATELYCKRSKLERKQQIEPLVTDPVAECVLQVELVVKSLKNGTRTMLNSVKSDCMDAWIDEGTTLSDEWVNVRFAVLKATCLRKGDYKDSRWNECLLKVFRRDLRAGFHRLGKAIERTKADMESNISGLMTSLVKNMKGTSTFEAYRMHDLH
jgi:hypothetical protein